MCIYICIYIHMCGICFWELWHVFSIMTVYARTYMHVYIHMYIDIHGYWNCCCRCHYCLDLFCIFSCYNECKYQAVQAANAQIPKHCFWKPSPHPYFFRNCRPLACCPECLYRYVCTPWAWEAQTVNLQAETQEASEVYETDVCAELWWFRLSCLSLIKRQHSFFTTVTVYSWSTILLFKSPKPISAIPCETDILCKAATPCIQDLDPKP